MGALPRYESADGQQMQLEPVPSSELHPVATADAHILSSGRVQDAAQHHASDASLAMPAAASHTQAEQPHAFSGVHSSCP